LRRDEGGFTTLQYVVATGFSLVLFVLVANLLVDLYAQGAVRDALDEGVRAAVPMTSTPADCEVRVHEVIRSIAGGSLLRVDELRCERDGDSVVARADISLRSWLPMLVPDWRLQLRALARQER
jgi:hypothetical protein